MKVKFLDYLSNNRIYLDGAFGSELIRRGFTSGNPEMLNISNPGVVKEIYDSYISAGSDVISTNTFGANSLKMSIDNAGLEDVISAAVKLAKQSAGEKYVAYSCGPIGELLQPFGNLSFEKAYALFKEQALIAERCGVDYAVIETMSDTLELKAAVLAFKENTALPVACSMSFDERMRTFTGVSIGAYALIAQGLGVDLIGLNCGLGPDLMLENAKELIRFCHKPVFVKPNAGLPAFKNGAAFYDTDSEKFSDAMADISKLGISVLGGCCGTNAEYISKTILKTRDIPFKFFDNKIDAVCSSNKVVEFKPTLKIGEKVNPTGRPLLKKALTENDLDFVSSMCVEQVEQGADLLDINAGMSGIDEAAVLTEIVKNVQSAVTVPLQIDSSRAAALESALRVINGIPVINSVNGEKKSMENIFPLAKKYGAYVTALCLDENGVPQTVEGRIEIAKKLIENAQRYGVEKQKLLFDALTLAVSVDGNNAEITRKTVVRLRDELGVKTILGLSNVSFGLPAREVINAEFYRRMLDEKITAVIIDPALNPKKDAYAADALSGKDNGCGEYIKKYSVFKQDEIKQDSRSLFDIVLKGLKKEGIAAVDKFVNKKNYLEIIEKDVVAALNVLGGKYERGEAFLPQLIASAESAKAILAEIKSRYMAEAENVKATVLLATVKGDVHDIGKNIVKAVLGNYGYKIVDLGKDVDSEVILESIKKHNAQVVGLSALMTTTLENMAEITGRIKRFDQNVFVMVGGAVVTQGFAETIGADFYCKDAQDAVKKLSTIF